MTELLIAAQMRAIEKAAIEAGQVTGLELMERAGRAVVEAIFEEWPELAKISGRAVVLCGPGNNGGDGFVVARLLKEWGWDVEVFLYGDPDKLPPHAKTNFETWIASDVVHEWDDNGIEDVLDDQEHDLVVDALFGTGMKRSMPDDTERTWHGFVPTVTDTSLKDRRPKYVAVDCPSGLCCDSGVNFGAFPADLTVSFHSPKLGHYLLGDDHFGGGPGLSSKVIVADIGLKLSNASDVVQLVSDPVHSGFHGKWNDRHKYSHGHALILSGGAGKTGAARLAARGALRIGAGLVTLGVPPAAQMEVAAQVTAIMLQRIKGAEGLTNVLQDERLNALCLGPGFGLERARELVPVALAANRATVLDADALTAFADDPSALFAQLHENCVLTPHGGEFARLFPGIAEKLSAPATQGPAYSKVDATREAAKRAGCVILFKGPDTVIAAPNGRCSVNAAVYERAAPWLATAGSGDVLAGFVTGLLARGFAPMQAAETAAWLHVECAHIFGPGLIAEDLPEQLPKAFKQLDI
ncbi:Nicotinamide nucleotide repair protein [Ruegeria denitrificans]|uniref:Bifunctional NAD(P)H-hydrate repair enzyme n=1 Tax=Ruegeria denitrificans TaxID=1715692 RepID=A0A0P1I4G1_9RHOB|nr:bifunctional ADP-dependent NAD(P)H-hydrate dehydratase/NAD(P)H-hydrate epimerase [Ruegeria denitrificans]CUJ89339.1 Nicotinamide nucleotide repair protein [Ruegeria denitrificans]